MANPLARREHMATVRGFQRWVRGPLRILMIRRLYRILTLRRITAADDAVRRAGHRLADAIATSFAAHVVTAAPELAAAVKDPQQGVSLVFTFTFGSRDAIVADAPAAPKFAVVPGWHHG
jgi:hypothetical protein